MSENKSRTFPSGPRSRWERAEERIHKPADGPAKPSNLKHGEEICARNHERLRHLGDGSRQPHGGDLGPGKRRENGAGEASEEAMGRLPRFGANVTHRLVTTQSRISTRSRSSAHSSQTSGREGQRPAPEAARGKWPVPQRGRDEVKG